MGAILVYFRAHRWQRSLLTVLAAVAVGAGGAVALRAPLREYLLLRDLGSPQVAVRNAAINRAAVLARQHPHVLDRLNRELDAAGDVKFQAITRVLEYLGAFRVAGRGPNQLDRLRLIEFMLTRADSGAPSQPATSSTPALMSATQVPTSSSQTSTSSSQARTPPTRPPTPAEVAAETRYFLFQDAVFTGRDNLYTRRLLAAAARDESPAVRRASAVLAARFADANTLLQLLSDPDPNVVEWAAIDAGLAGLQELADPIAQRLKDRIKTDAASGCAYALVRLKARDAGWLCAWADSANQKYRERLACSFISALEKGGPASLLNYDPNTWPRFLLACRYDGFPSPQSLLMVKHAYFDRSLQSVYRVLSGAVDPNTQWQREFGSDPNWLSQGQVLAALETAGYLWGGMPVRNLVDDILRRLWQPDLALTLTAAARVLGRQIDKPQEWELNAASRDSCIQTLRQAALYQASDDSNLPDFALAVPAAAAAVALWLREPSGRFLTPVPPGAEGDPNRAISLFDANSSAYLIYRASCGEHRLVADYIAWHLSRAQGEARAKAFELGMNLLPPPADSRDAARRPGFRNYSAASRSCAAMMLALSARTPQEKDQARRRVASRLEGGPLGVPADFYEIGSYKCALLILGEPRFRGEVAALLHSGAFPLRRAMTALCAAGDRAGLDWLLWDLRAPAEEIARLYIGTRLGEVLSVLVPELPAVDEAAGEDLRDWQVRRLQDYYRIHREKIRFARGE